MWRESLIDIITCMLRCMTDEDLIDIMVFIRKKHLYRKKKLN